MSEVTLKFKVNENNLILRITKKPFKLADFMENIAAHQFLHKRLILKFSFMDKQEQPIEVIPLSTEIVLRQSH